MLFLTLASLIWAFSFGLIKRYLTGLDPAFVAFARLALSFAVFLPFLRLPFSGLPARQRRVGVIGHLLLTGALEYGVMYVLYLSAYQYLPAWQVALFTVFTPLEVMAVASIYRRDWRWSRLAVAGVAVVASGLLSFQAFEGTEALTGFLLVQGCNLCFAWGQIHHVWTVQKMGAGSAGDEHRFFAIEYLGGVLAVLPVLFLREGALATDFSAIPASTGWALLYSGVVASGLGFFLWNLGASRVNPSVLSVMNNLKAPLAMAVALLVFGEQADPAKLVASLLLLGLGLGTARWLEGREGLLASARKGPEREGGAA